MCVSVCVGGQKSASACVSASVNGGNLNVSMNVHVFIVNVLVCVREWESVCTCVEMCIFFF